MADLSILESVFLAYVFLVFAKSLFCLASVPVALAVVHRRLGGGRCLFWGAAMLVAIPIACALLTPILIVRERHRFFGVYSNFHVMREVISGL